MIQRVQSLLLLIAAILTLLLIYLPVYETIALSDNPGETAVSIGISRSVILEILNGATGVLCIIAILLYKGRKMQIRLGNLAILVTCIFIALLFFMADTMSSDQVRIHYLAGSYFPMIQVLLIFIANRFIKKDENLVRSAERLR